MDVIGLHYPGDFWGTGVCNKPVKDGCHHDRNAWAWVVFLIPLVYLPARPTGVHRTCRQANEIELTAAH